VPNDPIVAGLAAFEDAVMVALARARRWPNHLCAAMAEPARALEPVQHGRRLSVEQRVLQIGVWLMAACDRSDGWLECRLFSMRGSPVSIWRLRWQGPDPERWRHSRFIGVIARLTIRAHPGSAWAIAQETHGLLAQSR
jgi:hypothetical protein